MARPNHPASTAQKNPPTARHIKEIEPNYLSDPKLLSQAYRLLIEPNRIVIKSSNAAGAF